MTPRRPICASLNTLLMLVLAGSLMSIGCSGKKPAAPKEKTAGDSASSTPPATSTPPVVLISYEQRQGMFLYGKYCAVCHGLEGKGDGFNAFNLDPRPRDFTDTTYMKALSDDQILQTIMGGGRSVNKSPLMPAYGWTLTKSQIRYVIAYLHAFATPGGTP
jgi:mono/diheme cytochrome c family protein